jgi:hypothetical protein
VTFFDIGPRVVYPGEAGKNFNGRAGGEAYAINVGISGASQYWTFPVGVEDPAVPGELTWEADADFSAMLHSGDSRLFFQAVDGDGTPGPVEAADLMVAANAPTGLLVIELVWDALVDVDLYVRDPSGALLSPKNINTFDMPAPGEPPPPPNAWEEGGIIDYDSNGNCVLDGRNREYAVWEQVVPSGTYEVYVDLASACGKPRTSFSVSVIEGSPEFLAQGSLFALDAEVSALSTGTALLVGEFEVP